MDFLDNSGHVFSLPSYSEEPIGHEFEENDYIFWLDNNVTSSLSVNNYYSRVINLVIPYDSYEDMSFDELVDITISMDSHKFWLLKPTDIQNLVNETDNISNIVHNINAKDNYRFNTLTNDDLYVLTISNNYENSNQWVRSNMAVVPLYILGKAKEEGTWISNILIHIKDKSEDYESVTEDWASISVGGIFKDENEILTINGQNMGITLPKEMFRAVYQQSFLNDEFNENLYNLKLKEYLINFMNIKGEQGNFRSANNSLKWFGYKDHLVLTKLMKTDNDIKEQYVHDWFNLKTDLIKSFKYFRNSTFVSIKLKENQEIGERYLFNEDKESSFFGEGKPILENLFKKEIPVKVGYDEDQWTYWKPYYDFTFYEMGLKLSCLKYYYETYFLPIHLKVHSATIAHQVFTNDIKFDNKVFNTVRTESIINTEETFENNGNNIEFKRNIVEFDSNNVRYFTHQIHYVDENFNEYKSYNDKENGKTFYKIDDTCLSIPIRFNNDVDSNGLNIPTYFNCVLLLEREGLDNETINQYRLNILNHPINIWYYDINILSKQTKKPLDLSNYEIVFSEMNQFNKSDIISNGLEGLKTYLKTYFAIPVFSKYYDLDNENYNLEFVYTDDGEYIQLYRASLTQQILNKFKNYDSNIINNLFNILDQLSVTKEDEAHNNFKYLHISETPIEYIDKDWYIYIPPISQFNFNPMNTNDIYGEIFIVPKVNIQLKFDQTEIHDFIIKPKTGNSISIKDKIRINYIPLSKVMYESHFNFVQDKTHLDSVYNSFILYPKYINNQDINYFINKKFTLRLLVNNHWYKYDFETKMPDVNLKFGTLKYKYYSTTDNYYSRFSQLLDLTSNSVTFNSFMYHPEFVEVNHINFFKDLDNYIKLNSLKYLSNDGELLKLSNFNRYIDYEYYDEDNKVKKIKIYISKFITDKKFFIYFDTDWLQEDYTLFKLIPAQIGYNLLANRNDDLCILGEERYFDFNKMFFIRNYDDNTFLGSYVYFKIDNNKCYSNKIINKYHEIYTEAGLETIGNAEDWLEIIEDLRKYNIGYINLNGISGINRIKKHIYLPLNSITNNEHIEIQNIYDQEIKYNIVPEINNFYNRYTEKININNENYLNNILIFNIFKNNQINKNIFNSTIFGNVKLSANGIMFSHNDLDEKIYLKGKALWSENIDSKYLDLYGFYINQKDSHRKYPWSWGSKIKPILGNLEAIQIPGQFIYYQDSLGNIIGSNIKINYKKENLAQIICNNIEDFTHIEDKLPSDYKWINNNVQKIKYEKFGNSDNITVTYKTGEIETNKFILNVKYIKINPLNGQYSILNEITNYDLYRINSSNNDGNLDIKLLCTIIKISVVYEEVGEEKEITLNVSDAYLSRLDTSKNIIDKLDIIPYGFGKIGNTNYMIGKRYDEYYAIDLNKLKNGKFEGIKIFCKGNSQYLDNRISSIIEAEQPGLYVYNYDYYRTSTENLNLDRLESSLDVSNDAGELLVDRGLARLYKVNYDNNIKYLIFYERDIKYAYDLMSQFSDCNAENCIILEDIYHDFKTKQHVNEGNNDTRILTKMYDKFNNKKSLLLNKIIYSKTNTDLNKIDFNILDSKFISLNDDDIVYVIYQYQNQEDLNPIIYKSYTKIELEDGENTIKGIVNNLNTTQNGIYKYVITNKFNYIKNYIYTLTWETNIYGASINLFILKENSYEILKYKDSEFLMTDDIKSIQMSFVVENNVQNTFIDGYIIPKIFSSKLTNSYSQLKYIPSSDSNKFIEINIDGNKYVYDDNTDDDKVKLYNDFFEIDYLATKRDENGRINEENTGTVYEIEKLFNIEKNYLKWSNNNQFTCRKIISNTDLHNNTILITNGDVYYEYTQVNDKDILAYFDSLSEFNKYNLVNLIKYDFSIKTYIDFYDCHVYKYIIDSTPINEDNDCIITENLEEIKLPDYFVEENYVKVIKQKINLKKFFDYDFYLMHDYDYWYGVFISKEVISKNINNSNLKISKDYKVIESTIYQENDFYENNTPYVLKLVGSSNEFLINRMMFEETNGVNHFDNDKMIVAKLENNNKLPVDIFNSPKWEITPKSIGMDKTLKINSNQNMALISFPENNNVYQKGYYDVKVRYSLDKNIQHQLHKDGIIRIG